MSNDTYLGITCHFLDQYFRLHDYLLDTIEVIGSHTADLTS